MKVVGFIGRTLVLFGILSLAAESSYAMQCDLYCSATGYYSEGYGHKCEMWCGDSAETADIFAVWFEAAPSAQ
jgi:hypothetical protein